VLQPRVSRGLVFSCIATYRWAAGQAACLHRRTRTGQHRRHRPRLDLYLNFDSLPPRRRELILQRRRKFDDFLRTLLREGKADGTVRHDLNEEIAALGILTALNSMYLWWDPKRESNVDVPKQFAQLFISGVAADSGCSTR
jgi:Tetracyclin repressor-like, C-terminal domain